MLSVMGKYLCDSDKLKKKTVKLCILLRFKQ